MSYGIDLANKALLYNLDIEHYAISCECYQSSKFLYEKLKQLSKAEREHTTLQTEYETKSTREAIKSIVFSAFTTEAFINNYLINKSPSKAYFDEHLDRMSLLSKWVIGPKVSGHRGIDPSRHVFQKLKQLIKWRNDLAHFKRFTIDLNEMMLGKQKTFEEVFCADSAKAGIECVYLLVEELKAYDASLKENPFEELFKKAISKD